MYGPLVQNLQTVVSISLVETVVDTESVKGSGVVLTTDGMGSSIDQNNNRTM